METEKQSVFPPLAEDIECEVCIVGAGIAGLTAAYLLARDGKGVIVIDDGPVGSGQTQKTTAHLSNAIDDRYTVLEGIRGEEISRVAAESHTAAIDRIESIAEEEEIDCDFLRVDGYLFAAPEESTDSLDKELDAARRAGLQDVEKIARAPLPFDTRPCLRFPRQGQFHPLNYLNGLAKAVKKHGGVIHTGTHVSGIESDKTIQLKTATGTIRAWHAILATNAPISDNAQIYSKQAPYISYVIAADVPKGYVPLGLYWDTLEMYHYVRIQPKTTHTDSLIIGGEDHKTGQANDAEKRFHALEVWARTHFPEMGDITHRWSGQVLETIDGLAMIGKKPAETASIYIATGDSGMGMTHGTIAGILLTDLIAGRENPWKEAYEPSRTPVKAAGDFLKENANVAAQFTDYLTRGDVEDEQEIKKGQGAVLRKGIKKIAVFRDEKGDLHTFSAICPHKGCIVAWNSFEQTWDCPCHGSRFACKGTVINGPSIEDLKREIA